MIFTMSEAYDFCKPHIDGGTCNPVLGYARINEAVRRLFPKTNASRLIQPIRMVVRNSEFALPREAEKIMWVDTDGVPASIFSKPYEFMHNGPGDFAYNSRSTATPQIKDLGEKPYMFSLPGLLGSDDDNQTNDRSTTNADDDDYPLGFTLAAFSEYADDVGKEITVRGWDILAQEIRLPVTGGLSSPGLTIKINQFYGGVEGSINGTWSTLEHSSQNFRDIGQIYKPVTKGHITIYAIYEATNEMVLVGKYHPDETLPMFRRYRFTSKPYVRLQPSCTNVLMLVKMRYVPMTRATDVVPFDSLDAVKLMCIAITYENAKDLNNAILFEQNAERVMKAEMEQKETAPSQPMVIDVLRELGGRQLYRGRL